MKFQFQKLSARATGILIFLITMAIVIGDELFEALWPEIFSERGWVAFHILLSGLVVYAIVGWGTRTMQSREALLKELDSREMRVRRLDKQKQIVFEFGRDLVQASDQQEMIDQLLRLALEITGSSGASFVPFDEREQPLAATSLGILPTNLMDPWAEHLASQHVRDRCQACSRLEAGPGENCPMLTVPFNNEFPEVRSVHCVSLRYGARKVGMLTLYLNADQKLEPEVDEFLRAIVDETALGLESLRLREREISALQQLQRVRQKTDLEGMVAGLLEHIQHSMEADYVVLSLTDQETGAVRLKLSRGKVNPQMLSFAEGILQGVIQSVEPVMMSDVAGSRRAKQGFRSIMAAPLSLQDQEAVGAILVGNGTQTTYTRRQLELLQTLSGYLTLLVNNARLLAELEYKTMLEERTRLAREIHDGLAQTLGFLKLQVAQLQNYLNRGEMSRLESGLRTSYSTLANAYLEVRDAIDGLRTNPADDNIQVWLNDMLRDFTEATGAAYQVRGSDELCSLPPEIQIQLIRIVQEALSNVRKHAHAQNISVACWRSADDFFLEVQDDGRGFSPDEVSKAAQYGLRGMRERCELIGAEFQVISKPHAGTRIRIGLYMPKKEKANHG